MKKKKTYPTHQTKCIDDCICPYCGHRFNGQPACNYDMSVSSVECPVCGKEMYVNLSIEYMCTVIED